MNIIKELEKEDKQNIQRESNSYMVAQFIAEHVTARCMFITLIF